MNGQRERAFNIDVEPNLLWTGIAVGLSAVLIIRTNLATIRSFQVGGELAYSTSRWFLIDHLNRTRHRARRAFLIGYRCYCRDIAGYPTYFTSLEATLAPLAAGSALGDEIRMQLAAIRGSVANPDTDPDARYSLTGLMYDYFGPAEVDSWAKDSDYGNR